MFRGLTPGSRTAEDRSRVRCRTRPRRRALAALAAGLSAGLWAIGAGSGPAWAEWDAIAHDPAPTTVGRPLHLPMPCGGRLTLLRVDTSSLRGDAEDAPNWLADKKIKLGFAGADVQAVDSLQTRYIQGAFADIEQNARYYYIGKYEVTRAQYAAVMTDTCPDPDDLESSYPVTDITWYDAVDFTRRYTAWLYGNAAAALPRAIQSAEGAADTPPQSFVRLPTEEEWEFAARGGLRVSADEFRDKVYPIAGGEALSDHAWYNGPESSRGELQVIGLLNANPLGLHDVLGNAEEFVLEPFRLTEPHRLHGQAGGFVTKGGSFRTPQGDIRTSRRDEYGYFDPLAVETGDPARRRDTFGFRVVLSAPVQVDYQRIDELNESYEAATAALSLTPGETDPLVVLQALADRAEVPATEQTINTAVGQLLEERGAQVELEGQALRAFFLSGAVAGQMLERVDERYAHTEAALKTACDFCRESGSEAGCRRCNITYPAALDGVGRDVDAAQNLYMTNLMVVGDEFPVDRWGTAGTDTLTQIEAGPTPGLRPFADLFMTHVQAYQRQGDLDLQAITEDVRALRE
ncbi:formylglycine-generating enzyme family protein [Roseospira marina]|nr:SUMF1/EgtB/PvdO family nonheme iron enzyme [Roseospira marina]MBB5089164.1 hypothetical protein [Roseospira marina]